MSGYQDVGKCQQPGEDVVEDHLFRKVLEEEVCFFLVDVEPKIANLSAFQSCYDGLGIYRRAAACVYASRPASSARARR